MVGPGPIGAESGGARLNLFVMAGLDPAISRGAEDGRIDPSVLRAARDHRVKPGDDDGSEVQAVGVKRPEEMD